MSATTAMIEMRRVGPLTTLQDAGRFGMLAHGIGASGPMDRAAYRQAGARLTAPGATAIEFTQSGVALAVSGGAVWMAGAGGAFTLSVNGRPRPWPGAVRLAPGDSVDIRPGATGIYGYLRFGGEIDVPPVMGSRATNATVGIGGLEGRALRQGDRLAIRGAAGASVTDFPYAETDEKTSEIPTLSFLWGIHADFFSHATRADFLKAEFVISNRMNRMGIRLDDPLGVFTSQRFLSLVSDAVVPGDIQILGDGSPTVLMRDHQPTGGYPRIATLVARDQDRIAQMRPGTRVRFKPTSLKL